MTVGVPEVVAVRRDLPVTIAAIAILAGAITVADLDIFAFFSRSHVTLFNPLYHVAGLFFHENWAHYESNVLLLVPLGVVLTLLTNDRHVLLVVLTSHALASLVTSATRLGFGIGASAAVLAIAAAVLVRPVDDLLGPAPTATVQSAVVGLLAPFLVGLYVLVIVLGGGPVGHFAHFLGFLFGGAIEAMYVFGEREGASRETRPPGNRRLWTVPGD